MEAWGWPGDAQGLAWLEGLGGQGQAVLIASPSVPQTQTPVERCGAVPAYP